MKFSSSFWSMWLSISIQMTFWGIFNFFYFDFHWRWLIVTLISIPLALLFFRKFTDAIDNWKCK